MMLRGFRVMVMGGRVMVGRVMVMGGRADVDMHRLPRTDPTHPTQFVNVVALVPDKVQRRQAMYGEDVEDEA